MWARTRRHFTPPVFEGDEDRTRAAGLLNTLLLVMFPLILVVIPVFLTITSDPLANLLDLAFGAMLIVLDIGLLVLMRRGYVRAAGVLLSSGILAMVTAMICIWGGIHSNTITAYLLVVILAALLVGRRATVVFGLLSMLAIVGVYYGETHGAVAMFPLPATALPPDWIIPFAILGWGTLLLRHAVRSIADGFERARRNAQTLAESNRELQASRDMLRRELTARKQAEQALRESQQLLQKVFANLRDAVFIVGAGTPEILECNPAASKMFGYSREELVGRTTAFLHADEAAAEEFRGRWHTALEQQGFLFLPECRMRRKDGTVFLVEFTVTALTGEQGEYVGSASVVHDITARRQTEKALEQRAAQLALLNDVGRRIAAVSELSSVLERAARLVQGSFGYHHVALFTVDRGRGELVMKARAGEFAHLFPLEHRLKLGQGMVGWAGSYGEMLLANDVDVEPRYVNLYPGVVPTHSELSVPIRVGEEIVGVLDAQSPQRDAFDENNVLLLETLADQIAAAVENARLYEAVQQELVERKRAEEEMKRLKEFSERIVQTMAEGIVVEDAEGRLTFLNPAAVAMLGYTPEELMGQHWTIFTPPDQQPIIQAANERRAHGEADYYEIELARKDGVRFAAWVSGIPRFEEGRFAGTLAVFTDITERKRVEGLLARKVEELTRSNAELERFAYVASHDLQEPLRQVTSYSQLLERRYKGKLDAEADEFIQYVVDGAARMRTLINGLLAYSRVNTHGKPFKPTDCSFVLKRVLDNLRPAIEESEAVVTYDALPTVMADAAQLVQVFQGLVGNALKFHGELPPTIHVGAERQDDGWQFGVRDSGIGIDPQHLERIFAIFQRLHSPGEYSGTNVGLAICRRIAERHGGRIWVESEPGRGSTFYFTIPDQVGSQVHAQLETEQVRGNEI